MRKIAIIAASVLCVVLSLNVALAEKPKEASKPEFSPDPQSLIPDEMKARYAKAVWSWPSSGNMADIYPSRALNEETSGVAVVACAIETDGSISQCRIMAEAPKGYGFGVATATTFIKYAHVDPATVQGGIKPGDFWVFTYKWQLG